MPNILIVDDDPRFRRTLVVALDSLGYQVSDASGGKEALDLVQSSAPDVVVVDWQMPDLDGLQTCRALRAGFDVPVIMVSGNGSNSRDKALDAGANDFLTKPFSLKDLVTSIESTLKSGS